MLVRKGLNGPHLLTIYAENQHCDATEGRREKKRTRTRGKRDGLYRTGGGGAGMFAERLGCRAVLTRPGLTPDES